MSDPPAGPGLGRAGGCGGAQAVPAVGQRGEALPAGGDVLLVDGELAVEVVDHPRTHPHHDHCNTTHRWVNPLLSYITAIGLNISRCAKYIQTLG